MKAPQDIDRTRMVILPEQEHGERLARVLKYMAKAGLESMLLCDNANKFYITGRIFDGYIYIGPDGRVSYFVRRPSILEGKSVHHIHKPENILEIIDREGLGRPTKLGLELTQIFYATVMRLAAALGVDSFGNADSVMLSARAVKTAYEIQQIAVCGMRHDRVYSRIPHLYHEGMSDVELQIEIERVTRLEGGLGIIRTVGQSMEINMGSVLAGRNADEPSPYDFALGGAGSSPALPVGADGEGGGGAGAAEGEIVGRRLVGVASGKHAAHVDLHALADGSDDAQTALEARHALNLDLQLNVRHAFVVQVRDAAVHAVVAHAADGNLLYLVGRFYGSCAQHHRVGVAEGVDTEGGGEAHHRGVEYLRKLEAELCRAAEALAVDDFEDVLGLVDMVHGLALEDGRAAHKVADPAVGADVDVAVEDAARDVEFVGVVAKEHAL